ncbi:hypothetical protein ACH35V_32470 [Actinomadura sp. 1N219]|uniref:hypothetical protein n=1 Tax=Actinomadura sp. 1N219 TaxID=3375152 RepID=UPI0037A5E0E0
MKKKYVRAGLATGAAVLALGTFAGSASAVERADTPNSPSAAQRSGTPHLSRWYIGSGNAYGNVLWIDYRGKGSPDVDDLWLSDDFFPSGFSVKMTVVNGSHKKTVHAKNGELVMMDMPGPFPKGRKAKFKACAWDNGEEVICRPWTTITE